MSSILIDHSNKLGDNFMFNGIVREYCRRYDRVGIFCMPQYYASVSFMYRDLKNLQIEISKNHRQKQYLAFLYRLGIGKRHYDEIKSIYSDQETGIVCERQLYALAGVDFGKKWSSFRIDRDKERELSLFKKIVPFEPYAFIHDDAIYKSCIDDARITSTLPRGRVEKNLTNNALDYCLAIERAAEIHVVDSAFMFLIDCLPYSNPAQKLFVHRYARTNPRWNLPVLKKPWTILS